MFRPIRDQILVKPNTQNNRTKGGLTIPDSVLKETPMTGKVISVGKGYYSGGFLVELDVAVDNVITWMPYAGKELEINNEKLVLLREADILGVL